MNSSLQRLNENSLIKELEQNQGKLQQKRQKPKSSQFWNLLKNDEMIRWKQPCYIIMYYIIYFR